MRLEHTAFNVADPRGVATWYVKNLGMKVVRKIEEPPYMHFLADDSGTTLIEIYNKPPDQVPDYGSMDPLLFHLAFVSNDPTADKEHLLQAGARLVNEMHTDAGDHLVMVRDPWGHSIQLCKRKKSMLSES
jgi:catechol 2,3-dioxygenase-like lactoylglutathione lyase family enzyme